MPFRKPIFIDPCNSEFRIQNPERVLGIPNRGGSGTLARIPNSEFQILNF
jgi:hypothetical protein